MSMQTWVNYGYGVKANDIQTDMHRLFAFIDLAPNFKKEYYEWLEDNYSIKETNKDTPIWAILSMDDILCYEDTYGNDGIAAILLNVMTEKEKIDFYGTVDYNGDAYVMYPPAYPWQLREEEHGITQDFLTQVFKKYIKMLTEEEIEVDFYAAENFG